ncbi:hypothetical protein Ct61P_12371 [Colletotrichum tofieldiae]|nr:hypothetical protein Ct61P_12371 [Colletotrichum tofieldiae]
MAAGKTGMGTLDTQDYLLRGLGDASGFGEFDRAKDVCKIVKEWGLDGVIRMEIGFESIYCDFFDGLDLVSVLRRPWSDQIEGGSGVDLFDWARAAGQRRGEECDPGRVGEIVKGAEWDDGKVDWQGIVDLIVSRHADRIEALADEGADGGDEQFLTQVLSVTNTFVDYPLDESDSTAEAAVRGEDEFVKKAREQCAKHYLEPATVWRNEWTQEDGMIYVAVSAVAERICGDLFDVRGLVLEAAPKLARAFWEAEIRSVVAAARDDDDEKLGSAVKLGREAIKTLKEDLGWSIWKKCKPGCDVAEVCFIAMWPFGLKADHYQPSCHNRSALANRSGPGSKEEYWEWEPRPRVM